MGRPYSLDLRERVIGAVHDGMSCEEAADLYQVSKSSAIRWARRERETGSAAALPMGGKRAFALAEQRDWLLGRVAAKRDITLRELLAELADRGIAVSYYALWHILDDAGISFKKKPARQRTGPAGRCAPARPVAAISGQDRSQPAGVHR
jgi:transposase